MDIFHPLWYHHARGGGQNDPGERLARLRAQAGLSQDDLAERLDVSRQSVSKWENNISVPDLDKLVKLGEVFGISLDELVKGEALAAAEPGAWRRLAALYRECGYLLGWAISAWGAWDLLRCVWSCLVVLPVLGIWEALYLLFVGMLTAYVPGFLKIILGAGLVLRGKRLTGHLRWYHLALGAGGGRRLRHPPPPRCPDGPAPVPSDHRAGRSGNDEPVGMGRAADRSAPGERRMSPAAVSERFHSLPGPPAKCAG